MSDDVANTIVAAANAAPQPPEPSVEMHVDVFVRLFESGRTEITFPSFPDVVLKSSTPGPALKDVGTVLFHRLLPRKVPA
jgi:hypothetical protein